MKKPQLTRLLIVFIAFVLVIAWINSQKSLSIWKTQTFSTATDGLTTLSDGEHTTIMGSLVIDLVSAPIAPGTYHIHLNAVMGGIQIFLPAYARVQLNGETFWGGNQVYRGEAFWQEMRKTFANSTIQVPSTPPAWASASYEEYPVTLYLNISTIMGGAHIYQLEPNPVESRLDN